MEDLVQPCIHLQLFDPLKVKTNVYVTFNLVPWLSMFATLILYLYLPVVGVVELVLHFSTQTQPSSHPKGLIPELTVDC